MHCTSAVKLFYAKNNIHSSKNNIHSSNAPTYQSLLKQKTSYRVVRTSVGLISHSESFATKIIGKRSERLIVWSAFC